MFLYQLPIRAIHCFRHFNRFQRIVSEIIKWNLQPLYMISTPFQHDCLRNVLMSYCQSSSKSLICLLKMVNLLMFWNVLKSLLFWGNQIWIVKFWKIIGLLPTWSFWQKQLNVFVLLKLTIIYLLTICVAKCNLLIDLVTVLKLLCYMYMKICRLLWTKVMKLSWFF